MRPQDPVLPSTVGIMTLLVAAHRALLRSLNTCLWDPPAKENCGSASRRLQWNSSADTSSHPDVFLPNQAEMGECVAGSEPMPEGTALPTHIHSNPNSSGTSFLNIPCTHR